VEVDPVVDGEWARRPGIGRRVAVLDPYARVHEQRTVRADGVTEMPRAERAKPIGETVATRDSRSTTNGHEKSGADADRHARWDRTERKVTE
jgi:hypothetical protein